MAPHTAVHSFSCADSCSRAISLAASALLTLALVDSSFCGVTQAQLRASQQRARRAYLCTLVPEHTVAVSCLELQHMLPPQLLPLGQAICPRLQSPVHGRLCCSSSQSSGGESPSHLPEGTTKKQP